MTKRSTLLIAFIVCVAVASPVEAQDPPTSTAPASDPADGDLATGRKPGTYLKLGGALWQGDIFSSGRLTRWDVNLNSLDYDLTSLTLEVESYFGRDFLFLSGFSIAYRKDGFRRAESGHMVSGGVFHDFDLRVVSFKAGGGVEWGTPSLNFDQTAFSFADDGSVRYRHTYIHRNADIPGFGTRSDGVVYPFAEVSVVQRPWFLLFEIGMRLNFVRFNFDDYEVGPHDELTQAFGRKREIVPYIFADIGLRLF